MNKLIPALGATVTLALSASPLMAQEEVEKLWSGDVEFGYIAVSGNSNESSMKGRVDANRETSNWLYNFHLDTLNSDSEDVRTAEKYFLSSRLGKEYSETDFIFGYASYDDDRFSGFDSQITASMGWGRRLINNDVHKWDIEVGPGYRISNVEEETATTADTDEAILRLYTKYSWNFSPTANFTQTLNVETGSENTITKSDSSVRVQVIGALSMKLSYIIKYTEVVPDGTEYADTETAVTLAYSF